MRRLFDLLAVEGSASMPIVLIVEDEEPVRRTMAETLTGEGFTVIQTTGVEEALRTLETAPNISVVVTGVEMPPGRKGSELATEAGQRWPSVRFVVTSAREWPDPGDMPASAIFLPRPWTSESFVQVVWEAMDRARLAQRG